MRLTKNTKKEKQKPKSWGFLFFFFLVYKIFHHEKI
jgi:hypothetical protein